MLDLEAKEDTLVGILLLRDAAAVTRYHTKRTLRQQSLADHSYGVIQLLNYVWPECRKELLLAGAFHDLPEYVTGDIPAPIKRKCPQLGLILEELEKGTAPLYQEFGLSVAEELVLGWCDTFELVLWCHEEVMLGNQYTLDTLRRGLGWCQDTVTNRIPGVVPFHVARVMQILCQRITENTRNI